MKGCSGEQGLLPVVLAVLASLANAGASHMEGLALLDPGWIDSIVDDADKDFHGRVSAESGG